jgi:hypothetical protein
MATKEDEHAVSKVTLGPCVPRKYDTGNRDMEKNRG